MPNQILRHPDLGAHLLVLRAGQHGKAGGVAGQDVQRRAADEEGGLAVAQPVPDQRGGAAQRDGLYDAAQLHDDGAMLRTVAVLGEGGGEGVGGVVLVVAGGGDGPGVEEKQHEVRVLIN